MATVMIRRVGALGIALGLVASLPVTPALAASIVVNSLADTAANDGACTLREAITSASTNTVSGAMAGECAAGLGGDAITFGVAGRVTLNSTLPTIASDLSITGAGAVTISGASAHRVFLITGGTVSLSGLTITGGATGSSGGGIFSNHATLSIANSTISGNTAAVAGGGLANFGTVTITNSTIAGNTASLGGGVYNNLGATATVTSSSIGGNTAAGRDGGGIANFGTLAVASSTISGNTAGPGGGAGFGGGMWNDGTVTITSSTISGNTAVTGSGGSVGGGIYNSPTRALAAINSTISGNTADFGGGIFNNGGSLTATNVTISGNTAPSIGGGILTAGTETLVNVIVAGNTSSESPDINVGADVITTSIIGVPAGKTLADILVPAGLADNGGPTKTIALAQVAGNPAVDAATAAVCAAAPVSGVDQRGLPRPAACDIGAYEIQPPTTGPGPITSTSAPAPTATPRPVAGATGTPRPTATPTPTRTPDSTPTASPKPTGTPSSTPNATPRPTTAATPSPVQAIANESPAASPAAISGDLVSGERDQDGSWLVPSLLAAVAALLAVTGIGTGLWMRRRGQLGLRQRAAPRHDWR